jgi:NAD(P)-dependent dehydrogenase (short-subunit alcohol dehydrogenase family)
MVQSPLGGRTAVVTGALGRLGPVWVQALADAGARVLGIDVRTDGAADLEQAIANAGGDYVHRPGDVGVRSELEGVLDEITELWSTPSILVCNAGIDQPPDAAAATRGVDAIPSEDFRATLDVNLVGTFHAIQVFGAAMAEAKGGSIVTIGSLYASRAPDPKLYDHLEMDPPFLKPPAYGASKAGVISLTKYFARLWGPRRVRVNALSPGGVRGDQDAEFVRKYCARVPLGRMAEPEDLAGPLIFLASDASSYLTGHELLVDGGLTA